MSHEKDARLYMGKIILRFSLFAILFAVPSTKEGHIFNNITEIDHPYCVYFEVSLTSLRFLEFYFRFFDVMFILENLIFWCL